MIATVSTISGRFALRHTGGAKKGEPKQLVGRSGDNLAGSRGTLKPPQVDCRRMVTFVGRRPWYRTGYFPPDGIREVCACGGGLLYLVPRTRIWIPTIRSRLWQRRFSRRGSCVVGSQLDRAGLRPGSKEIRGRRHVFGRRRCPQGSSPRRTTQIVQRKGKSHCYESISRRPPRPDRSGRASQRCRQTFRLLNAHTNPVGVPPRSSPMNPHYAVLRRMTCGPCWKQLGIAA